MIFSLIIFIIAIIITFIFIDREDYAYAFVLDGFIFLMLLTIMSPISYSLIPTTKERCEEPNIEIYSIDKEMGGDGSFFLGCGDVGAKQYYCYYIKGEMGGFIVDMIEAQKCEIVEREDTEQKGYIYQCKGVGHRKDWIFGFGDMKKDDKIDYYIIEVPKGTMQIGFNIGGVK